MKKTANPTIKDIARMASVTIGTVDRVLHERGRVSEDTAAKIRKIIAETGYTTNVFARTLVRGKNHHLVALIPEAHQDSGFWKLAHEGIARAAQELKIYKVDIEVHTFDRTNSAVAATIDSLLSSKDIDGVCIAPVFPPEIHGKLRELTQKIPCVFFDATVDSCKTVSEIGQDHFQSGVVAGKLMQLLESSPGNIGIMQVYPDDLHITERTRGFISVFSKQKAVPEIYNCSALNLPQSLKSTFTTMIQDNLLLTSIFVPTADAGTIATICCAKKKGLHIIGYDLIAANAKHLNSGAVNFLISQRPLYQSYEAMRLLYRTAILHQPIPAKVTIPIDIISRENAKYYEN